METIEGLEANFAYQRLREATGSTPGGVYQGRDGITRYIKYYSDPTQAAGEHLANCLYRALNIPVPASTLFTSSEGRIGFASEWVPWEQSLRDREATAMEATSFLKGAAIDLLTANWDVVGVKGDNIVFSSNQLYRVDNGGAFFFRGRGKRKPESALYELTEWDAFADEQVNPGYFRLLRAALVTSFGEIPDIDVQTERITMLLETFGDWNSFVRSIGLPDSCEPHQFAEVLNVRTQLLVAKF